MSSNDTFQVDGLTPQELLSFTERVHNRTSTFLDRNQREGYLEEIIKVSQRYGANTIELLGAGAEAVAFEIQGNGFSAVIRVEARGKPIEPVPGILPSFEDTRVGKEKALRISVMPKFELVDDMNIDFRQKNDLLIQLSRLLAAYGYSTPEVMNERNVGVYILSDGTRVAGVFDPGTEGYFLRPKDFDDRMESSKRDALRKLGEMPITNPMVSVWNERADDIRRDIAREGSQLRAQARDKSYENPVERIEAPRRDRRNDDRSSRRANPSSQPADRTPCGWRRRPCNSMNIDAIIESLAAFNMTAEVEDGVMNPSPGKFLAISNFVLGRV